MTDTLASTERRPTPPSQGSGDPPPEAWDHIHFRILRYLHRDARMPVASIAREVDRTSNAVRYRLRGLRTGGVIRRFRVHVEPAKLGPCEARLILARGLHKDALTALRRHPAVGLLLPLSGAWDWAMLVAVPDKADLHAFLHQLGQESGAEQLQVLHVRPDAEMPLTLALCQDLGGAAAGDSLDEALKDEAEA